MSRTSLPFYREISGRDLDQLSNEHTILDVDHHAAAVNPYDHGSPHIERLSRAFRLAAPPRGGKFLDMGCGWGLSSEIGAYCGLKVTSIDINPDFVELVNRRVRRLHWDITASQSAFDTFETDERFDMILFYECFHRALKPWDLATKMGRLLRPGGKMVLAGEPINAIWWKHWGMRLDRLSVYCTRKFGWLESGWSPEFLERCFHRAGLAVQLVQHPEAEIGFTVVGHRIAIGEVTLAAIAREWNARGWAEEPGHLTFTGEGGFVIPFPAEAHTAHLRIMNYRRRPLRFTIRCGGEIVVDRTLNPGETTVELDRSVSGVPLDISAEQWILAEEIGNEDTRSISMHLIGAAFV